MVNFKNYLSSLKHPAGTPVPACKSNSLFFLPQPALLISFPSPHSLSSAKIQCLPRHSQHHTATSVGVSRKHETLGSVVLPWEPVPGALCPPITKWCGLRICCRLPQLYFYLFFLQQFSVAVSRSFVPPSSEI